MTIEQFPPLRIVEQDGSPDVRPVYEIVVSNGTLTRLAPGRVSLATGGAGGGSTVVYAPTGGVYVVSAASNPPLINAQLLTGGSGITITTASTTVTVAISAKTVRIPLALMTVAPDSANAFWTAKSGTTVDQGYVAYLDSGVGWATYWGIVPTNLAPSPLWNLDFYNSSDSGSGGNLIFSLSARMVAASGSIDTPYTNLVSVGTLLANTANILGISTASATNFDGTLALSANNLLFIEFTRHANLAADGVNAQWDLFSTALKLDVL